MSCSENNFRKIDVPRFFREARDVFVSDFFVNAPCETARVEGELFSPEARRGWIHRLEVYAEIPGAGLFFRETHERLHDAFSAVFWETIRAADALHAGVPCEICLPAVTDLDERDGARIIECGEKSCAAFSDVRMKHGLQARWSESFIRSSRTRGISSRSSSRRVKMTGGGSSMEVNIASAQRLPKFRLKSAFVVSVSWAKTESA